MASESSDPELTGIVHMTIAQIAKRIQVEIPKQEYPLVFLQGPGKGSVYLKNEQPAIHIRLVRGDNEGNILGIAEEAGHFVREYVRRSQGLPEDKRTTQEFFGYLGKRIIGEIFGYQPRKRILTRKEALEVAKEERKQGRPHEIKTRELEKEDALYKKQIEDYMALSKNPSTPHDKSISLMRQATELVRKRGDLIEPLATSRSIAQSHRFVRENYLAHARGYGWADSIDISKLNFKELYTLPDSEVRKRFFTNHPQYSLEQRSSANPSSGGLARGIEQFIGTASIIFFLLGGVSSFVTGKVVASVEEPIGTPGVFFLIGIFGLLVTGVIQAIRNVR